MPGGQASHKSTSVKPNTNTNGLTNAAAEEMTEPHDITTQSSTTTRVDEAPENAAATERPENQNQQ